MAVRSGTQDARTITANSANLDRPREHQATATSSLITPLVPLLFLLQYVASSSRCHLTLYRTSQLTNNFSETISRNQLQTHPRIQSIWLLDLQSSLAQANSLDRTTGTQQTSLQRLCRQCQRSATSISCHKPRSSLLFSRTFELIPKRKYFHLLNYVHQDATRRQHGSSRLHLPLESHQQTSCRRGIEPLASSTAPSHYSSARPHISRCQIRGQDLRCLNHASW